jgi:hypothetical protein
MRRPEFGASWNGVEQNVHVSYGDPGGVQECTLNSGSGQNLTTASAAPNRFEMQGGFGGGPVYTTYAATQVVVGTESEPNSTTTTCTGVNNKPHTCP